MTYKHNEMKNRYFQLDDMIVSDSFSAKDLYFIFCDTYDVYPGFCDLHMHF